MVDSAWAETALDDLETSAWTKNHEVVGDTDVLEGNVTVSVGSIVEAEDGKHTLDGDTRGGGWDDHD